MSMIKTFEPEDLPAIPTNIKRKEQAELRKQIDEYLARGNKIQVATIGESGYTHKTLWERTDAWEISQAARQ